MNTSVFEQRAVITPPFPVSLPNNVPTELARVTLHQHNYCQCSCVIVSAVVNYSATFTPPSGVSATLTTPGFADVTFELLLNGTVVYRVIQTALQKGFPLPPATFSAPSTTFEIASLLHCNQANLFCGCGGHNTLILQATASLTAPGTSTGTATTTAQVGAVTLVAELLGSSRDEEESSSENS